MPVLPPPRRLHSRQDTTGKSFSIVFSVIAFLVVAACIVWGYLLPQWRKKHPPRPSSTRYNCLGGAAKKSSSPPRYAPRFPGHPAVRGVRKKEFKQIRRYDPRTESPFPPRPEVHQGYLLAQIRGVGETWSKGSSGEPDIVEPSYLAPRPAGRAPTLSKQLDKFPVPSSDRAKRFDTLAHPNLLFEKLQKLDTQATRGTAVASAVPSPPTSHQAGVSRGQSRPPEPVYLQPDRRVDTTQNLSTLPQKVLNSARMQKGKSRRRRTVIRMRDRLDALSIRDTLHLPKPRPKTPTAKSQSRSSRTAARSNARPPRKSSLRKYLTPSTEPLTLSTPARSGPGTWITPPTSPPPPTNSPVLVPTPLRLRRAALRANESSPTPCPIHADRSARLASSMIGFSDAALSLERGLESKRARSKSTGFYHPSRTAGEETTPALPARLTIDTTNATRIPASSTASASKYSLASPTSPLQPPRALRGSDKGSSIYSRTTKGMSLIQTPTYTKTRQSPRANSVDILRSKIDAWDLQTPNLDLHFPGSPITTIHRPPSSISPLTAPDDIRRHTDSPAPLTPRLRNGIPPPFGLTVQIPSPCLRIHRSSDDVFGSAGRVQGQGRVLRRVLDMEMASSSEGDLLRYKGKTAPGGAEWI